MMLHRHFDKEREDNMTTTADFAPKEKSDEAPKRRGRPKKESKE